MPPATYHRVGPDWDVKTVGIDKNANYEVADENMFNSRPRSGYQYVLVRVRTKKVTAGAGQSWWDLDFRLYGKYTRTYYREAFVVAPDELSNEPEVDKYGYVTGNLVFEVRRADLPYKLHLLTEDAGVWTYDARVWFSTT